MVRAYTKPDVEEWRNIPEFPNYDISSLGNVYNKRFGKFMRTSLTTYGHVKITLTDFNGRRFTRSVAQLVAEAFIEQPSPLYDHVVVLDGDYSNVSVENLVWRPRWFAWKYARQLNTPPRSHYQNLRVRNIKTGEVFNSIVEAGMAHGLIFADIWRSTHTGDAIYPYGYVFEVIGKRV